MASQVTRRLLYRVFLCAVPSPLPLARAMPAWFNGLLMADPFCQNGRTPPKDNGGDYIKRWGLSSGGLETATLHTLPPSSVLDFRNGRSSGLIRIFGILRSKSIVAGLPLQDEAADHNKCYKDAC